MTTTVQQLIDYLNDLPPETEVAVVVCETCGYEICADLVDLDLSEEKGNAEFIDLEGNQFVKEDDPRYKKKYLYLGET